MKLLFPLLLALVAGPLFSQTWQDVGGGANSSSHGMCVWDGKLVNAGSFNNPCQKVATWDGAIWGCLGGGVGLVGRAAIEWNGNLVVVGDFWNNFQPCSGCNGIGVWDGTSWTPLGTGFNNDVLCLAIWNGDLVAGGDFTEADGVPCSRVARWDGTTWQPIGGPTDFDNDIRCMVEYDGEFWVGGDFNNVAGCSACDGLVKWDGTNWVGGNSGVDLSGGVDSTVRVLYVNPNDGNLYMGGHFIELTPNGVLNTDCNGVAMYDGSDWYALGTGVDSYVRMIHEYNGNVIVGGDFNNAGGVSANKIAKWNPGTSTWSAMGTGMNGYVKSGTVWNGTLYAGGDFTTASGLTREYIASWYETPSTPPVANINSSATAVCAGNCISFSDLSTNTPTTWDWSFPGATVTSSSSQNPGSICYNTPGTYTVTLEACNGSGCDISTMNVTINATPGVSFTNQTICAGQAATLTAVPSSGGGTYLWSPGGQTTPSIVVSPASTTNYQVVYTLNGCASTAYSGTVSVNPVPTVTVPSSTTICNGANVNLCANASPPGGTMVWNPGSFTSYCIIVAPSSTTIYTATYTLNGCVSAPASTTITVNTTPTVSVNSETICGGATATLVATPSVGGGNYSWSPGGATTQSIDVTPASTGTYTVNYLLNGCPATPAVSTVTVIAPPTVSVNDPSVCSGASVDLVATPSASGGTYSWSPGGATTSTISVSPGSSTSYTVTYTITGCPPTDDVADLTVTSTPTVNVNDATICNGETTTLTAIASDPGGTFLWSPGGEITPTIDITPGGSASYSVTYTFDGCTSIPAVSNVTVNPLPDTGVNQSGATLTAVQNTASYQWLDCESMTPISGETAQVYTSAYNGDFAVTLSLNGCLDTSACFTINTIGIAENESKLVLVYPNPTTDSFTLTVDASLAGNTYFISDSRGRIVLSAVVSDLSSQVDLSSFERGLYFLQFETLPAEKLKIIKL